MQSAELRGSHKQHTVPFIMNIRKLLLISAAILGFVGQAAAQTPDQVTVARVTGTVTAQLPDGSTVDVKAGSQLPQGATITTGDKSEAYLVSHGDTTTTIVANSEVDIAELSTTGSGGSVTKQTTTLDLKSGNIVAKLNPAKKSVNNYSVRTPKGVAAARGTVFTVSYKGGNYTIAVVNGVVTVTPPSNAGTFGANNMGAQVSEVSAGRAFMVQGTQNAGSVGNLNSVTGTLQQEIRELMAIAVATVTIAAQNGIGGTTAAEAAAVAQAVFTTVPGAAEQAGAIIKQSNDQNPPADAAAAAAVLKQVSDSTPAAAQDAFKSGTSTGTFTPNPTNTSTDTPATNSSNSNSNNPNTITTPQPIDPSTVSRSGE